LKNASMTAAMVSIATSAHSAMRLDGGNGFLRRRGWIDAGQSVV
jgi:hypothetical protein